MTVPIKTAWRNNRRWLIPALAGIMLLMSGFSAAAASKNKTGALFSAAYLLQICERDAGGTETVPGGSAACQSYISGIIDYHNLLRSLGTAPSIDICVPADVKLNDLQTIVFRYLQKNAQHDAFVAAPAVVLALFEYYPCDKPKPRSRRR
jgi:hypothetical protein